MKQGRYQESIGGFPDSIQKGMMRMSTATISRPLPFATPADVREWAAEQGYEVGDRGRLRSDVIAEYNRKHRRKPYVVPTEQGPEGSSDEPATLMVTGMRRGRSREGQQVFTVDVSGTLTFTVPGG